MNFFRSEEHLRIWPGFEPAAIDGVIALTDLIQFFSGRYFKKRMEPDYFSHIREYEAEMIAGLEQLKDAGAYWRL
jgi:hypothetical protein